MIEQGTSVITTVFNVFSPTITQVLNMALYGEACESLTNLFNTLPPILPLNPPNSLLPPMIDPIFAKEEGAWPAFNKAMHAAFGDKSKGIRITERGDGLTHTMAVIRCMLQELDKDGDAGSSELVKLWIDALTDAAKAAGGKASHGAPGMFVLFLYSDR